MAALVQNGIRASRVQAASPATTFLIQRCTYSANTADDVKALRRPSLSSMKRGTGGRSSFSGIVATVFGATGYLGMHVCHRLGKIGSQIIIPYRGDHYDLLPLRLVGDLGQVLYAPFNLRDEESIYRAVRYSNVVINLIGRDWETKNFTFDDVNVEGAARIARISKMAGVERLIWMSDLNAAEKPKGHLLKYGSKHLSSKWRGEAAVRAEFPDVTIFKPAFIAGPNDKFIRELSASIRRTFNRGLPMYKKGEETVKQPVFVHDVAEAIVKVIRDKDSIGKTYQAIGPKRYKLGDLGDWFNAEMRTHEYFRYDIRYDPLFRLIITMNEKLTLGWPIGEVHWEILERECVTDKVDSRLPTLEDLGINLTPMEDYVPWVLRPYRNFIYYDAELNEFAKPIPPQPVV